MIDSKTNLEVHILARAFQTVLLRVEARAPYWVPICDLLHRYRAGAGMPLSSHAGQTDSDKMAFSRMLTEMAGENRITLAGKARAHAARLTDDREAELLELADLPSMPIVFQCMKALRDTKSRGIGDGWQLVVDQADQKRDRLRCANTQFSLVPAVLRGWIDWTPSMQTGYVFARLTESGIESLKIPYKRDRLPKDDDIAITFDDATEEERDSLKALRPDTRNSQNIGDIPFPYSFGTVPRKTVMRIFEKISLPR